MRLIQCVAQKGGVLSNPAEKEKSASHAAGAGGKEQGPIGKVQAHPIVGWKGFEDVLATIPGETVDVSQKGFGSSAPSMLSLRECFGRDPLICVLMRGIFSSAAGEDDDDSSFLSRRLYIY